MVSFSVDGREQRVAMQIEESEAKQLLKVIDKALPEMEK
jgi:hypothetical protein